MPLLDPSFWVNKYRPIMKDAHDTFDQKIITYMRYNQQPSQWKEDDNRKGFVNYYLGVLINYNYMRTWPITKPTESGELDKQSMQVYMNKDYLREMGLLSPDGNFDYNPDYDRFIVDGILKKAVGDTPAAQAGSDDIFFTVILKSEENETGEFDIR